MAKVKMLRKPKGAFNGKPFPEVGKVLNTTDAHAEALVNLRYAKPVGAKAAKSEPDTADQRETREDKAPENENPKPPKDDKPAKRGPGRPRKTENADK